jgi:hypothetical protein
LYLKIGEDRALALSKLTRKMGVDKNRELTPKEITDLGDAIVNSGVTAEQLTKYAEKYPAAPSGIPADLTTFLDQVKSGKAPEPGATAATAPPEEKTQVAEAEKGAPKPKAAPGEKAGEEFGGVKAVDAKDRATDAKGGERIEGTIVQVVNPSGKHTKGTKPVIHLLVSVKGVAKVMVTNVEAEVMNHTLFPDSAKTYDEAYFLTIFYGLKKGVKITEIPNGIISAYDPRRPRETAVTARIYTSKGEEWRKEFGARQMAALKK